MSCRVVSCVTCTVFACFAGISAMYSMSTIETLVFCFPGPAYHRLQMEQILECSRRAFRSAPVFIRALAFAVAD